MYNTIKEKIKIIIQYRKQFIFYLLSITILTTVIIYSIAGFITYGDLKSKKIVEEENQKNLVDIQMNMIYTSLNSVISDLEFLAYSYTMQEMFNNYQMKKILEKEWIVFSKRKKVYDQIRYINFDGDEVIRINNNNNDPEIVKGDKLQNKKDRYYFKNTNKLEKGQIYISNFDLNIENGEVEKPVKPMIRFGIPVFDSNDNRRGIVILNYYGKFIINKFKKISTGNIGHFSLLNSDSYWLIDVNKSKEWGFMFSNKQDLKFSMFFKDEWNKILSQTKGQFYSDNGLYTFDTVILPQELKNSENEDIFFDCTENWKVVSFIPKSQAIHYRSSFMSNMIYTLYNNYYLLILSLFFSLVVSILLLFNKVNREQIKIYATYDAMTGTYNRRAGLEKLQDDFNELKKKDKNLSICFIDINGLKLVNDTLGHEKGDELIKTVANTIKENISQGYIIRLGGDEYLLSFPFANKKAAEDIWTKIYKQIQHINETEKREYVISLSHGIEELKEHEKIDLEELIKKADEKMYKEKQIIKKTLKVIR